MKRVLIVLGVIFGVGLIIGLIAYFSKDDAAQASNKKPDASPVKSPYPVSNTVPTPTISTHTQSVRVVPGERAVAFVSGGPIYDYTNQDQIVEYTNSGIGIGYVISPEGDQYISVGDEKGGEKKYLVENKYIHSQA